MAAKLIGAQATMTTAFAGDQDGSPSAYSTAENQQALLKSWSCKVNYSTVNLAALADTEEQLQVIRASGSVDIEAFVDATNGPQFYDNKGQYAKFIITPKSGITALTFTGVVTAYEYSGSNTSEQTEKMTITIGTNGV